MPCRERREEEIMMGMVMSTWSWGSEERGCGHEYVRGEDKRVEDRKGKEKRVEERICLLWTKLLRLSLSVSLLSTELAVIT